MLGKKSTQPLPSFYKMKLASDYTQQGYGEAKAPSWLKNEYVGHGKTHHSWAKPVFELTEGTYADLLRNDLLSPLVSPAFREAVEANRYLKDIVHWLPVTIRSSEHGNREFFLLNLPYRLKILVPRQDDLNEVREYVEMPPISAKAVGEHQIFTYLDPHEELRNDVLVAEPMKKALEEAGLTGFAFSSVEVTHDDVFSSLRKTNEAKGRVTSTLKLLKIIK